MSPPHPLGDGEATLLELRQALEKGDVDSVHLVAAYRRRIDHLNRVGPCLDAVLEVEPDALEIAVERDRERREGRLRGALHGLPILLKDNLVTAGGGTNTSYGSYYLQGLRYRRDSTVAARLKAAGAILLGKSNMVEFGSGTGVPSGRGGPVRNPYALDRGADGSSNGLCAAVAADLAPAGVGTDSRSSIRFPAADCSLVGLKPTFGRVSLAGVLPGEPLLDVAGPMARSVGDVALLLSVLAGPDPDDPATADLPPFAPAAEPADWDGVRVGFVEDPHTDPEIARVVRRALERLAALGAELVEGIEVATAPYSVAEKTSPEVFGALHPRALARFFDLVEADRDGAAFEAFRFAVLAGAFPTLRPRIHELRELDPEVLDRCRTLPEEAVAAVRRQLFTAQQRFLEAAWRRHRVELLVFATKNRPPAPLFTAPEDVRFTRRGHPEWASHSGWPELTLPVGFTGAGLPVGLSLLGPAASETRLLALAASLEEAVGGRRPPVLAAVPPRPPHAVPPRPEHSSFVRRAPLQGSGGEVAGNLLAATVERGEPRHGTRDPVDRSVWYGWRAERDGRLHVELEVPPGARYVVAVYRSGDGDGLEDLREVACSNHETPPPHPGVREEPGRVLLPVEGGRGYAVAVGAGPGTVRGGGFTLRWRLE